MGLLGFVQLSAISVEELNKATKEQLMEISGIGEAKAKAILEYRQKHLFKSVQEVDEVSGIGPVLVKAIEDGSLAK